jgi:hypothetical protein
MFKKVKDTKYILWNKKFNKSKLMTRKGLDGIELEQNIRKKCDLVNQIIRHKLINSLIKRNQNTNSLDYEHPENIQLPLIFLEFDEVSKENQVNILFNEDKSKMQIFTNNFFHMKGDIDIMSRIDINGINNK